MQTLSAAEKDRVRKEFGISSFTFIPSAFGKRTGFTFTKDHRSIFVVDPNDYMSTIKSEMNKGIVHAVSGGNLLPNLLPNANPAVAAAPAKNSSTRAVIAFFENKKVLEKFLNDQGQDIKDFAVILTEDSDDNEIATGVREATRPGQFSLMTKQFGRGTDFKQYDEIVRSSGGVHVIQTFLSKELSEETQIQGRTARQGASGSYSMVLSRNDLEYFALDKQNAQSPTLYADLNNSRMKKFEETYALNKETLLLADSEHQRMQEFLKHLNNGNSLEMSKYLTELNRSTFVGDNVCRILILMDATGNDCTFLFFFCLKIKLIQVAWVQL